MAELPKRIPRDMAGGKTPSYGDGLLVAGGGTMGGNPEATFQGMRFEVDRKVRKRDWANVLCAAMPYA
ncbi:MAG: hypothetical protein C7B43_18920 [Sulfobacillus benefaciens]|uniref:Uncharacterized protein n=1 Tax=Sulfobacillus benefaciens TaxID=453960 RepID=A0A2T2WQI8_9FIRM|nr:MAG: hypothetical protein C7B43_18920 [Sulfobacillus benefaciens]